MSKFIRKLIARLPSKLPTGVTEFNAWSDDLMDLYDTPKNDSVRFAIATMILHADSTAAYKPKHYFGLSLTKSMANQVAAGIMQDLKEKQKAEQAAAEAALLVASDVSNEQH